MKMIEPTADLSKLLVAVTQEHPRQEAFISIDRLLGGGRAMIEGIPLGLPNAAPEVDKLQAAVDTLHSKFEALEERLSTPPPLPTSWPSPDSMPPDVEKQLSGFSQELEILRTGQTELSSVIDQVRQRIAAMPLPQLGLRLEDLAPTFEAISQSIHVLSEGGVANAEAIAGIKARFREELRRLEREATIAALSHSPEPDTRIDDLERENKALHERLAAFEIKITNLEQASAVAEDDEDLPAFVRKLKPRPSASPSPQVVDAVGLIESLDRRITDLTTTVNELLSQALPARPPLPSQAPSDYEAMKQLLQSMQEQIVALGAERPMLEDEAAQPAPEGIVSLYEHKQRSIAKIRAAGARRRDDLLGGTADARDVEQRLTDLSLNSLTGRTRAIELLEDLAQQTGEPWGTFAERQTRKHDLANKLIVQILSLELGAAQDIDSADVLTHEMVDRITNQICEAIGAIGGE